MPIAPKVLFSNLIAEMARFKDSKCQLCCSSLYELEDQCLLQTQHRMVREEVGDVNILVNNAGIMIIKQVLFKIIITLFKLAYIAALFALSSCNDNTEKRGTVLNFASYEPHFIIQLNHCKI